MLWRTVLCRWKGADAMLNRKIVKTLNCYGRIYYNQEAERLLEDALSSNHQW